jgi:hypothetical protein
MVSWGAHPDTPTRLEISVKLADKPDSVRRTHLQQVTKIVRCDRH